MTGNVNASSSWPGSVYSFLHVSRTSSAALRPVRMAESTVATSVSVASPAKKSLSVTGLASVSLRPSLPTLNDAYPPCTCARSADQAQMKAPIKFPGMFGEEDEDLEE